MGEEPTDPQEASSQGEGEASLAVINVTVCLQKTCVPVTLICQVLTAALRADIFKLLLLSWCCW